MAYNEELALRIRTRLTEFPNIEEKEMMGGLAFMYNGKMCVGAIKDELMCRIDPDLFEKALEQGSCRPVDFTGRPMRGWVMIDENGIKDQQDFEYWINLALDFKKVVKLTKKQKKYS